MWQIDRSRVATFEQCPRKRYLQYHYAGSGIESGHKDVHLWNGSMVHDGFDLLAQGQDLEAVVNVIREKAIVEAQAEGLLESDDPEYLKGITDYMDFQEGMLRAHEKFFWPRFSQEYQLVAGEQEVSWPLGHGMEWMSRLDRIVRRKHDGAAFVVEYKTPGYLDEGWRRGWRYDMQVISEVESLRRFLESPGVSNHNPNWKHLGWNDPPPHIGLIIVGLYKNTYRKQLQSPLVFTWMSQGDGINPPMFEREFEWQCTAPHAKCPGGKNHRLGKDYRRVRVRDEYPGGVKAWVEQLPQDFVDRQIVALEPIVPSPYETHRWTVTMQNQETKIQTAIAAVGSGVSLDAEFEMHTNGNNWTRGDYGRQCMFFDVCWGSAGMDLNGQFVRRKPNHPQEIVQIEGALPPLEE